MRISNLSPSTTTFLPPSTTKLPCLSSFKYHVSPPHSTTTATTVILSRYAMSWQRISATRSGLPPIMASANGGRGVLISTNNHSCQMGQWQI
ncbi:hypothetical protein Lalb_Chr03g0035381 [Lupinus albus]|uniref:Uncharacterized protein n=1 Tax=Lupinus albus TaxID=3870 RepID=A0A6A4QUX8_LUPAL|nr:hypothetical protein Lalb_Chr03g0035381 [Lupinus albus]